MLLQALALGLTGHPANYSLDHFGTQQFGPVTGSFATPSLSANWPPGRYQPLVALGSFHTGGRNFTF